MIDKKILNKMLQEGKAKDLLDLMEGESKYTSEDSKLALDNWEEKRIWRMSLEHVRFVSKFGGEVDKAEENSKFYSAYPEEFKSWVELGAPGLVEDDFIRYLKENPI